MNHNMVLLTCYFSTYRDDIFQLKFLWPTKKKKRSIEMCTISMYYLSLKQFSGNFYQKYL